MSKRIELTINEIKEAIHHAVNEIIKEGLEDNTQTNSESVLSIDETFNQGLNYLGNKYSILKGFISEYPVIVKSLMDNAKKIGLVLSDFSNEKDFNIIDALEGETYGFEFTFTLPDVDVSKMSEEEYDDFERYLDSIYDDLEYGIPRPKYGVFRMYTTENGITVDYSFRLV